MKATRSLALISLLAAMSALPACSSGRPDGEIARQEEKSLIRNAVDKAIVEARREIREGNLTLSENDNLPKAEITPQGDLVIGGKTVALDAAQRALMLDYREHIAGVAESGMEIGSQGADLATKAMGEAFRGILTGKSEQEIERSVEAEAAKIKASAAKLCEKLPAMMAAQQKLAAAVPEFRPYATMTQDDIDDCLEDTDEGSFASMNAAEKAAAAAREPVTSN